MASNMNSAGVDMNVFDQDLNFDESLLYVWTSSGTFSPCLSVPLVLSLPPP